MSIEISPPHVDELKPRIAVIGVGGAGGNAIANMIAASVEGVDFIVANTDAQALNASPAERRIQLGPQITEGLGAGSRPEIGKAAAEETIASVEDALNGAHMCFIAAGMGGGTGTGAAPVIAKAARDRGILTVGVVTKPFTFEGNRRMKSAEAGIEELQKHVDTLIVIPNQNLFLIANPNTTFKEAFQMADEVLQQGVRGITDLMVMPGLINLDFADVRSVMGEMGKAMMGTGEAEGDGRALQAAEKAIANPLLDGVSMRGAKGVIVSIVGGEDMRLMEVDEAANHIRELVDPDANIIWGSAFNDGLNGKIRVSVVATGIDSDAAGATAPLTQPFSFASRPAVAVPGAAAPKPAAAPAPAAAPEPEMPELPETLELDVPAAPAPAPLTPPVAEQSKSAPFAPPRPSAVFSDEDPSQDELLLGAEEAEAKPAPAPQAAPRVATGGTLFERMAGLTRGAEKGAAASDDGASAPDIPRFLNRQSNQ
ncbi:cell division protein FtsZ [Sphingobium chlorophenolicum L-1]|uniref:Cell division protein FtsZ n=1 Tax=Sphingobium chlorophenolicum L-1 TaxID=690566 RepID=F6EXM9_SPHCR|nr:cell division protein FtsZ [Sphingobium chlorophenolicum]AEG49105.1 cell division protein FtsZ [Sphingobium chlorophenolicum L-1]